MFSTTESQVNFSVATVKEIEAPLGGISIIYVITISEGDSSCNVSKTYREIEDISKKLSKKYSNLNFPELSITSEDKNERKETAQQLMKFICNNSEVIPSDFVKQLLGVDSEANFEIVQPKTAEKPIQLKKPIFKSFEKLDNATGDLFQEFERSNKLKKQQKGSASFFDEISDDEDDDLFGNTKFTYKKITGANNIDTPKTEKIDESDSEKLEAEETIEVLPREFELKEIEMKETKFMNEEIIPDDEIESIMRLDDDLDDFQYLTQRKVAETKNENANKINPKPVPPPKKPGLSVKKPVLPPKPELTKPAAVALPESAVDIDTYINFEQAANLQEAKLFD